MDPLILVSKKDAGAPHGKMQRYFRRPFLIYKPFWRFGDSLKSSCLDTTARKQMWKTHCQKYSLFLL